MSPIPSFSYQDLFYEKTLTCVSHLTRKDALDFFSHIATQNLHTEIAHYSLAQANLALQDLKAGRIKGAAVLNFEHKDY